MLTVSPEDKIVRAVKGFADYIKSQVLATDIIVADNDGADIEFDDFKAHIYIEKVSK